MAAHAALAISTSRKPSCRHATTTSHTLSSQCVLEWLIFAKTRQQCFCTPLSRGKKSIESASFRQRPPWHSLEHAPPAENILRAARIQADVEETEAILAAYWEGVLEETRRELDKQRRAAMARVVAAKGEERPATKSKAAKRKQQKRKAQQKKKAAERAGAVASAEAEEGAQGQNEYKNQVAQEQEGNEQAKEKEDDGGL